ncbi:hypothetical protein K7X08_004125 [Anisodus acutangulus]|uniref:Uncharacterized protein n=1 Tax=Anisodus acutangulus TaxID=402998 RepID=A0A9Q1RJF8_9SOLA|nr:hypothetical protein K7X08_004125 [Anisodus acutangulus]
MRVMTMMFGSVARTTSALMVQPVSTLTTLLFYSDRLPRNLNLDRMTEGLLVELNLLSCYDLLDQYCEQILGHLETISRQRECPENCKEPVGSLMFAAARLADLPELRQLRTMFNERYGNSLECHVNKHFAEKLKPVPHKADVKLQLMQDIAAESGVEWNSIALQQKLYEQKHKDVSGNNKESEDALSNHENMRHHHTKSIESTTKSSSEYNGDDDEVENAKPKQKSVRRKHMDPHENHGIKIPNGEVSRQRNRDGPSGRAASLPVELERISPEELMKGHIRANSCTPDMGHIHPRVPNYEEVVARLENFSGKSKE